LIPETKDIIHVVLAVYDPKGTYSRHAGVVMASLFDNTKGSVLVHILHDETLMERNRSFLTETAESFRQSVEFHNVSTLVQQLRDKTIRAAQESICSVGMLFRLAIPDILSLNKVIYLDCDVVVNMDIRKLWDIPVEGYSFAGVLDVPCASFSPAAYKMRLIGCDRRTYINSGVLLMNLPRIREKYQQIQK
jgi:lipopolysaccharide biosynthesis glycosyltransferase